MSEATRVEIRIYSKNGQLVKNLPRTISQSGDIVLWDGRNKEGVPVASGIYIAKIKLGDESLKAQKIVVVR